MLTKLDYYEYFLGDLFQPVALNIWLLNPLHFHSEVRNCLLLEQSHSTEKQFTALVYTTQVKSAFGVCWLATSEVIIQLSYSPPSIEVHVTL